MTSVSTLQQFLPPTYFDASGNLTVPQAEAEAVAAGIQARAAAMPPAQAAIFLALVQSPDLAPAAGLPPADLEASLDRLENASAALTNVARYTTALEVLSRVMVEQAAEQRENALQDRLNAREQAKGDLLLQAGSMREAASQIRSGAIASLVLGVVMAAVSIGLSALSISKSASASKMMKGEFDAAKLKGGDSFDPSDFKFSQQSTDLAAKAGQLDNLSRIATQLGQTTSGASTSLAEAESKESEAEGSELAARAQHEQSKGDMAKDIQQALDDMIKHIINFLKELREAQADQMRAFTRV